MSSLQNCKVQGWPLLILLKKKILLLSDGDRKKIIVTHTDHKTTGTADIIATVNTATPSKSYKNKIRLNLANVTLVVLVVCILYWRMREYTFKPLPSNIQTRLQLKVWSMKSKYLMYWKIPSCSTNGCLTTGLFNVVI